MPIIRTMPSMQRPTSFGLGMVKIRSTIRNSVFQIQKGSLSADNYLAKRIRISERTGNDYLKIGAADKAIDHYQTILLINGANMSVNFNMAVASFKNKDMSSAIFYAKQALGQNPADPEVNLFLAHLYAQTGQKEMSRTHIDVVGSIDETLHRGFGSRHVLLDDLLAPLHDFGIFGSNKRIVDAFYDAVIASDYKKEPSYMLLARCVYSHGYNLKLAEYLLNKVLVKRSMVAHEQDSSTADIYYTLANVHFKMGNMEKTVEYCAKLFQMGCLRNMNDIRWYLSVLTLVHKEKKIISISISLLKDAKYMEWKGDLLNLIGKCYFNLSRTATSMSRSAKYLGLANRYFERIKKE